MDEFPDETSVIIKPETDVMAPITDTNQTPTTNKERDRYDHLDFKGHQLDEIQEAYLEQSDNKASTIKQTSSAQVSAQKSQPSNNT